MLLKIKFLFFSFLFLIIYILISLVRSKFNFEFTTIILLNLIILFFIFFISSDLKIYGSSLLGFILFLLFYINGPILNKRSVSTLMFKTYYECNCVEIDKDLFLNIINSKIIGGNIVNLRLNEQINNNFVTINGNNIIINKSTRILGLIYYIIDKNF